MEFILILVVLVQVSTVYITDGHRVGPESGSAKFLSTVMPQEYQIFHRSAGLVVEEQKPLNYCSFFNNRAPSPQINLKNCTWYKENSCCLQSEIYSTFSKVKPLIGSSELCQQYLNYLMCYICAPNQFRFYGQERLTVCVEYCDRMYDACAEAILKGSRINQIYSNGEEFCKSRRYNIDKSNKRNSCFFYDIQDTNLNFSSSVLVNKWLLFIGFLTFTLVEKFLVPC